MTSIARQLIRQVQKMYSSCSTYRDSGIATTTMLFPKELQSTVRFSTRFDRSLGLVFEYERINEERDRKRVIWGNSQIGKIKEIESQTGQDEESAMDELLASYVADSNYSSWAIPPLLFGGNSHLGPIINGDDNYKLVTISEGAQAGESVVRSTNCPERIVEIWIDPQTEGVRRLVVNTHFKKSKNSQGMRDFLDQAPLRLTSFREWKASLQEDHQWTTNIEYDFTFNERIDNVEFEID